MTTFLGFGNAWYGGWELVTDAKLPSPLEPGYTDGPELQSFEGPINLTAPATSPTESFGEGEEDICFKIDVQAQVPISFGVQLVECEITHPILPYWGAGFDWRIRNAPKVFVHGWYVWDERHDYGPFKGALEIHPIRELRFYLPSERAEYRCLFMDTSGRGGELVTLLVPVVGPAVVSKTGDQRFSPKGHVWDKRKARTGWVSGKALLPWKSTHVVCPPRSTYREKVLAMFQGAQYDMAQDFIGLVSTATLNPPAGAVVIQSSMEPTGIHVEQQPDVAIWIHQGMPKFLYRFKLEWTNVALPSGSPSPWELVPGPLNPDKYGYEQDPRSPSVIYAHAYLSSADIHGAAELELTAKLQGKYTLKDGNRTLPAVFPFDDPKAAWRVDEDLYVSGRCDIVIPCPSIRLEALEKANETVVLVLPSYGPIPQTVFTRFQFRKFSLHVSNFPLPPQKIEWNVHTDGGTAVPYNAVDPFTIRIDTDSAPDENILVEVTVTDAIGTTYSASCAASGGEGQWHKVVPEVGRPMRPPLPDPIRRRPLRERLASEEPLTRAAARVEMSLNSGQGPGQAFRGLGEELARFGALAGGGGLTGLEMRMLDEFLATPGRCDARLPGPERLLQLSALVNRLGEALNLGQTELANGQVPMVEGRFGSFSIAGVELEGWELVDAQLPLKSVSGALSEPPISVGQGWSHDAEWQFLVSVPDEKNEIYAGRHDIQDFSGIACRTVNPLFERWGQYLRDLLTKAREVQLTGYWTYNVSGCQGYKVELQPLTDLSFTADDCHYCLAFMESSGRFSEATRQPLRRSYRTQLAIERNRYGEDRENVWIYVEKVVAGSKHVASAKVDFQQLETEVVLEKPGDYYVAQSRTHQERGLDIVLSRVAVQQNEEGNLVYRYFLNAGLQVRHLRLPAAALANLEWEITGGKGSLVGQSPLRDQAEFVVDVSAEALREGKTIRVDITAQAVSILSGGERILAETARLELEEAQNAPDEKVYVRGFESFFIQMPLVELRTEMEPGISEGEDPRPRVPKRYRSFEFRLSHFPAAHNTSWEVATEQGEASVLLEPDGRLRVEKFPDNRGDVQVTVQVVDPTGVVFRKSAWSYPMSTAYIPEEDVIFEFPAELCHMLDGEPQIDATEPDKLAGPSFSGLVLKLWRYADRCDRASASTVSAEMSRRLGVFAQAIRSGQVTNDRSERLGQWLERMLFRAEPLWLTILLSRLGVRAEFSKSVVKLGALDLAGRFQELSEAFWNFSQCLADPSYVQFGSVQRF